MAFTFKNLFRLNSKYPLAKTVKPASSGFMPSIIPVKAPWPFLEPNNSTVVTVKSPWNLNLLGIFSPFYHTAIAATINEKVVPLDDMATSPRWNRNGRKGIIWGATQGLPILRKGDTLKLYIVSHEDKPINVNSIGYIVTSSGMQISENWYL